MASTNGNGHNGRKLVVVQLGGGNDALNTVIPYNNGTTGTSGRRSASLKTTY